MALPMVFIVILALLKERWQHAKLRRPSDLVLGLLALSFMCSTTGAALELATGRASPTNQGWRYVIGVTGNAEAGYLSFTILQGSSSPVGLTTQFFNFCSPFGRIILLF